MENEKRVAKFKTGDKVVYQSKYNKRDAGRLFTIIKVRSWVDGITAQYEVDGRLFSPLEHNLRYATPLDEVLE